MLTFYTFCIHMHCVLWDTYHNEFLVLVVFMCQIYLSNMPNELRPLWTYFTILRVASTKCVYIPLDLVTILYSTTIRSWSPVYTFLLVWKYKSKRFRSLCSRHSCLKVCRNVFSGQTEESFSVWTNGNLWALSVTDRFLFCKFIFKKGPKIPITWNDHISICSWNSLRFHFVQVQEVYMFLFPLSHLMTCH